ncbi:hypothetical protein [Legionella sp.]|uniref:hypothetical protein n=1 Tax=Legionella sp. TaxID=459 RepID=UPI003CB92F35
MPNDKFHVFEHLNSNKKEESPELNLKNLREQTRTLQRKNNELVSKMGIGSINCQF